MAKCQLTITLNEPDRIYREGDTIRGTVQVQVDQAVHCKGLDVETSWKTHGRGNVDSDVIQSKTVFTGDWRAGETLEYPFELETAGWPPTYFGHHINVEHCVNARAKIPWAFDPKASETIRIAASQNPESSPRSKIASKITSGCIIAFIILSFFGFGMLIVATVFESAIGAAIIGAMGACLGAVFLVRHFMIQWTLGIPDCQFESLSVCQGDSLRGALSVTPKRNCKVNGITVKVIASESATSGSGTNRTTRYHTVFEQTIQIESGDRLLAGQTRRFDIECSVPEDAAPSFDLGDNQLNWTATTRIDVPRWPDWKNVQPFAVIPSGSVTQPPPQPSAIPPAQRKNVAEGITFAETVKHLWSVRDDAASRDVLVEATTGMTFNIEAIIERRLLYSGDGKQNVYANGHAVWARFPAPELPLILYVPHDWGR